MECPTTVNQKVCIEAKVTVEPEAKVGDVCACCVGKPQFEECGKNLHGCTYMVSQMVCVRFPLTISATASVKPAGIVCGQPTVKPSYHEDDPCMKETLFEEEDESMVKDELCLKPTALFEQKPEEKPCAEKRPHTREWYHCAPQCKRPIMPRCGLCFLPLLCLPFCRPIHQGCKNSRHRWPVC